MAKPIKPTFNTNILGPAGITQEVKRMVKSFTCPSHEEILNRLTEEVEQVDYRTLAGLQDEAQKLTNKDFVVITIDQLLELAQQNNWGLCRKHGSIYLYNGAFWSLVDIEQFQSFLGEVAQSMGVDPITARHFGFREQLYKQFLSAAHLQPQKPAEDAVLINLMNGTFEITPQKQELRPFNRQDFLTYQLPFDYDETAQAPLFQAYLDKVQPDKQVQKLLAEYLGYIFIQPGTLKLEKVLLMYGFGANGKSVFFEVVNALLGPENVSSYSLQNLTDAERGGSYRAKIADKLVNYATEISGKVGTDIFKAMVSGEPIEVRPLYAQPYNIKKYAKLMFNCNELPKDVEQTDAFYRRLLVVPFNVTVSEAEQDRELPQKIIQQELSGVFNWVLDGLRRLLQQKKFTACEAVTKQVEEYRKQSNSVQLFLEDENYVQDNEITTPLKQVFAKYKDYCQESGYRPCSIKTFAERLRALGFETQKKTIGQVVYLKNKDFL